MIRHLKVRVFKSIQELDMDLGQINRLLGANGCGKSNILEALGIVSAAVYGMVDEETICRRGGRPEVPRLYSTSNSSTRRSSELSFAVEGDAGRYSVSLLPSSDTRIGWHYRTEAFWDGKETPCIRRRTGVRARVHREGCL